MLAHLQVEELGRVGAIDLILVVVDRAAAAAREVGNREAVVCEARRPQRVAKAGELKLKPLVVTILDARGVLKLAAAQDGTSLMRAEIAHGKAYGALAMGMGSRALFQRAQEQAYFIDAVNTMAKGALVPVPGGVLVMDGPTLLGAVGVYGDTSDNDEACAVAGIQAAGLKANAG